MSDSSPHPAAAAIVPGAGASRRMGRPKLLLPYADGTVLGALVDALRVAGTSPIVVVAAADDAELRAWCAAAAAADAGGLMVALNTGTNQNGELVLSFVGAKFAERRNKS